ncbi:unnamed protein product [Mucor hiemalis]
MYAHVSNHAFANMYNHEMLIMKDYQSGINPLSRNILNFSYQAYRRIVHHVNEKLEEEFKVTPYNCYACTYADDVAFYTMDGNFQLKRRNINNNSTNALFGTTKSVKKLWGNDYDVDKYEPMTNEGDKDDLRANTFIL